MTAKELKRLRRSDLLEMLLALRKENEQLRQQLEETQKQLENRRIVIENCGSLAEAVLHVNGVFEATQAACEQYMENMRQRMEQQEKETKGKCDEILAQAKKQAESCSGLMKVKDEGDKQD